MLKCIVYMCLICVGGGCVVGTVDEEGKLSGKVKEFLNSQFIKTPKNPNIKGNFQ